MLNNNRQVTLIKQRTLAVGLEDIDQTNPDGRGLSIDLFIHSGSGTVKVGVYEVIAGTNEPILIHETLALSASTRLVIYPGVPTATNMVNNVVGRELRVRVTVATAPAEVSLGLNLIP